MMPFEIWVGLVASFYGPEPLPMSDLLTAMFNNGISPKEAADKIRLALSPGNIDILEDGDEPNIQPS